TASTTAATTSQSIAQPSADMRAQGATMPQVVAASNAGAARRDDAARTPAAAAPPRGAPVSVRTVANPAPIPVFQHDRLIVTQSD
ncbi:TPA: RND transporter, partial [Burkholderia territorii]|nr:RND transporter [Burkholderia territorii]